MTDAAPDPDQLPPEEIEMGGLLLHPGELVDGYRYERPVGKGGMAYVLLARDPGGNPVALKVLKASRMRTGLARFRREFRALSRLDHPNIIRVESWGDLHGHPYLAMEYVDGIDLHTAIRQKLHQPPEVRWPWVEDVLVQLCRALGHLSRRGLVHRDLKPSNVLIDARGTCKLTDFGIVKDLDPTRDPFVSSTLVGTWAYASPEQIAGDPIDHRSDLYSLGIILYAMLTGRRPFAATDMRGYLDLHRARPPRPPRELDPTVPPLLEEVCLKLLAKSPRDRFQSASEVLELLLAEEPETNPEAEAAVPTWQPPMVGRDAELAAGREALAALTRSEGGVLVFEGPEGAGRSRLVDVLTLDARRRGLPVYATRLASGEGAFESLLRLAREIGRELGGDAPPELARAIARFAQGKGRLPGDARYQLFDGVRAALSRLLERGPQVIALDDLHDAPAPMLDLLGYLVRSLVARDGQPLLVLAAARSDPRLSDPTPPEAGTWPGFRAGRDLGLRPRLVTLGPLAVGQVRELMADLLGKGPDAWHLGRRVHESTGGDPLFVVELVRGLINRGVIVARDGGGWRMAVPPEELTPDRIGLPPGLRQAIRDRLAHLDDDARTVLEVLSVAGREVDLEIALDVVELQARDAEEAPAAPAPLELADAPTIADEDLPTQVDEERLPILGGGPADRWMDALDRLVAEGIAVERNAGLGGTVDLTQRRLGDAVVDDLPDRTRARLHRQLAAALELRYGDSPVAAEAIGEHYRRAGDADRAWAYLSRAAIGLLERSLLGEAQALVQRARRLQEAARAAAALTPESLLAHERQALELDQVQAELHVNQGDWEAAEADLRALRADARRLGAVAVAGEAGIKLGTVLRRTGRIDEGEAEIREVLVDARRRHDRRLELLALQGLAGAAWSRGDLDGCERLASQGLVGSADPDLAEGRAGILLALTAVQASKGQLAAAVAGLSEAEELLRGLREKKTRANVLVNLSEMLCWRGDLAAATARADEALALARDLVYRLVEASALRARALATIDTGELAEARRDLEQGLALARELGITEEEVPIRFHLARIAIREGEAPLAETHLLAARVAAAKADPERYAPVIEALLAQALAMQGHAEEARQALVEAAEAVAGLHAPRRTELLLHVARAWHALGEDERCLETARLAARTAESFQFRLWALHAWGLIAAQADGDEADRARATGGAVARELLASLPPDRAQAFRRQPSVVRLLGMPLL